MKKIPKIAQIEILKNQRRMHEKWAKEHSDLALKHANIAANYSLKINQLENEL